MDITHLKADPISSIAKQQKQVSTHLSPNTKNAHTKQQIQIQKKKMDLITLSRLSKSKLEHICEANVIVPVGIE